MAVERTGADLRALRNFVHAGVGTATGEDLLRNFQDELAVAESVRTGFADGFWCG